MLLIHQWHQFSFVFKSLNMAECHLHLSGNPQRCWLELKGVFHSSGSGTCTFHTPRLEISWNAAFMMLLFCAVILGKSRKCRQICEYLHVPCSSCSTLPCVLTMQCSSLVGSRSFSGLWGATSEAASRKPVARILAARAALFVEGTQQHPELVSGQFHLH